VNNFFFKDRQGSAAARAVRYTGTGEAISEPSMFGMLPAYGFFIRHAKGIELNNVEVGFMRKTEGRPSFWTKSTASTFST